MFTSLNSTLGQLQTELREIKTGKLDHFSKQWKESTDRGLVLLEEKIERQDFQIRLLKNVIIKQSETIQVLKEWQKAAYGSEIRSNLVVCGLVPQEDEDRDNSTVT